MNASNILGIQPKSITYTLHRDINSGVPDPSAGHAELDKEVVREGRLGQASLVQNAVL